VSPTRRAFLQSAARLTAGAATGALTGCRRVQPVPPPSALGPAVDANGLNSLASHASAHGLLYGCAVNVGALVANPAYADLIRAQANIVVAENAMKWGPLRPTLDTYRFSEADAFVAFAEANRMKIRGHNLAWHRQNPSWFATEATSANARDLLVSHIETVVGRYAGRMHSWDVVNEAIQISDGRPDGMRRAPWLALVGDDYVELAFRTARDADPQALLTYNDYGIEAEAAGDEQKRQAVLQMLRRMIARHVPIDAVGIQSHIAAAPPATANPTPSSVNSAPSPAPAPVYGASLARFIADVHELGLQVFLTEMDVNDRRLLPDEQLRDAAVAAAYKQYLGLTLAGPAVRAVLTWGITDRYTWLNSEDARADRQPERPLPFDTDCHPKPAAFAMRDVFDLRHPDRQWAG